MMKKTTRGRQRAVILVTALATPKVCKPDELSEKLSKEEKLL